MIFKKFKQVADVILREKNRQNNGASLESAAVSDRGLIRENNEDSFIIVNRSADGIDIEQWGALFMVADGMGGYQAGEVASRMACEQMLTYYQDSTDALTSPIKRMELMLKQCDQAIAAHSKQNPGLSGMGTTVTAMVILDQKAWIVHVGDSRVYLFRNNGIKQLTRDHTQVQDLVEMGRLTPEEAKTHHLKHVITQAVGTSKGFRTVFSLEKELCLQDRLLLCSDGLYDMVDDDRIGLILKVSRTAKQACEDLVAAALKNGGRDNVTAVCVFL